MLLFALVAARKPLPVHFTYLHSLCTAPSYFRMRDFYRALAYWRAVFNIDIANLSIRLSVRLSVTFLYHYENGLTYRHSFSPYGSPIILVLPASNILTKYLANDTRYRHSYYRRRIGNRTQAFEWHQFQWLEWPLTPISRSRYYSTSNNSKMVQDRAIFTMAGQ